MSFWKQRGIIHRTYGGALLRNSVYNDPSLEEKQKLHAEEKKRIGIEAARMISDGETILLDSGTTTREIAMQIKEHKNLTVMTNAINIALELAGIQDITVMLTGGMLREKSYSLVGPEAESTMQNYYFDKLFLGVDGLDFNYGLTTSHPQEAKLNRLMVEHSNQVIGVTDSSKFGRHSFSFICDLSPISTLVTDTNITPEFESKLQEHSVRVIKV
ncbi:MAG: DeoR/GlpR family DNA-binding transcription regulator [Balneolaceae bacterium]|nr:DeoR/GlpR family DNA-binding transcription regulator [Balneolaceae bacterium]